MKPIRLVAVVLGLAAAGSAFGAKKPKAFRPSLTFAEIWHSSPATESGDSFDISGHSVLDATMTLDPTDVATFDGDTWFSITVGGLQFENDLQSDLEWRPGATSARLVDTNDEGVEELIAHLEWSSTQLTVHIEADTGDFVLPIAADEYATGDRRRFADVTGGQMTFGESFAGWHDVRYRVAAKPVKKLGSRYATVRAKGKGVASTFFTNPDDSTFE